MKLLFLASLYTIASCSSLGTERSFSEIVKEISGSSNTTSFEVGKIESLLVRIGFKNCSLERRQTDCQLVSLQAYLFSYVRVTLVVQQVRSLASSSTSTLAKMWLGQRSSSFIFYRSFICLFYSVWELAAY